MKFKSAKHDSQEVIQEIKNYKENGSAPHIYEDFEEIRKFHYLSWVILSAE